MIGSTGSAGSPPVGNLLYSEVEQDLRVHLRTMLSRRASWADVLARTESSHPVDRDLWHTFASGLGCAGLAVPDELGGGGATWREASLVAEELGRAVAPVPFLGCSMAAALLLELGERDLLADVVRGKRIVALALPYDSAPHESLIPTVEERDGLRGSVTAVGDASAADVLLVPTSDAIYQVDVTLRGVTVAPSVSLDMTRPVSDIVFDGPPGHEVARGAHVQVAIHKAQQIGATLLAAEQLGVAEHCLEMIVEYLCQRRQFGRLIGSYQALKHRAADLWVRIMKARAVVRYAAECAANTSDDLPVAAAMAQEYCSRVAQQAAEECLQMHGGIGFTWEHPVHLYLKRAKSSAIAFGSPDRHRTALATLLDLPS